VGPDRHPHGFSPILRTPPLFRPPATGVDSGPVPRQGAPDEPPQAASRHSLPEPAVLEHAARFRSLAACCGRCAPSLHHRETTPFDELPCQVSLFHLPVLRRNPNPLLGVQDLTGVQSASLIGRQRCAAVSPTVTSASSRRRAAPRCRCLWDRAR
jgi:hypothetical protein